MLCRTSRLFQRGAAIQQSRCYAKNASSSNSLSLKEYQEKYRTTASDILAALPKDGETSTAAESEKLSELFADYYDNIGAHSQLVIAKNKFRSSKAYEEIYKLYNAKISDFQNPFYAMTHFPLLSEKAGNKVLDEETVLNHMGNFFGIPESERPRFDSTIRYGFVKEDSWVLDLQDKYEKDLNDMEDLHQDAIESLYMDMGSDNHNCDLRGLDPLLEPNPIQNLIDLEKQYSMTAEEIESYNYLEDLRKELSQEEVPPFPEIPEL